MTDDAVLDKLVALGLRGNTIAALSLVPLIQVAWADGEIQDNERTAILQGAHGKGLEQGTAGYELLAELAAEAARRRAVRRVGGLHQGARRAAQRRAEPAAASNQIVGFAKMVAASAGGFLGLGKVSADEEKVLQRIEVAFDR